MMMRVGRSVMQLLAEPTELADAFETGSTGKGVREIPRM